MMKPITHSCCGISYFTILIPLFTLFLIPSVSHAQCTGSQTGGIVWRDFDSDGIKDVSETQGLAGVTVKAYNSSGTLVGTVTTNASGQYTFGTLSPTPTAGAKYRIEFSGLPTYYQPTFNGTNGRTDVQLIASASCAINWGVNNPADYCESNPQLSTTCFINGQASSNLDVLISFPYNSSGERGNYTLYHDALNSEVGSVYGLAYNKTTKKLFTAAFLKRHSALGSAELGGIYAVSNPGGSAGTPSVLVDLDNFSAQVGSLGVTPAARDLGVPSAPSRDADAFAKVAKVGLGDLELSDDGNTLYTVNLNTGRVIRIDLTAYNSSGAAITASNLGLLTNYTINCTNGTRRPFALKYYQGSLYLGVVCDAGTGGTAANLTATVLKWNGSAWSTVISFPLNYNRGAAAIDTDGPITLDADFKPWSDTFNAATWQKQAGSDFVNYAQPIFSDIEFDVDGSMVVSFMDRGGHQMGFLNYSPNSGDNANYFYTSAGEILRIHNNNGTYVLENNGVAGSLIGCGAINTGPGGKEFYCGDNFFNGRNIYHTETVVGGLGILAGKGEVAVALYDPLNIISGGVGWMSNTNGSDLRGLSLYRYNNFSTDTTYGKANGIGDIEFLCSPAPLQIGSYVWEDTDKDGVQDPNEPSLSNVKLELWKNGSKIAETTTNSNGEYYFSSKSDLANPANWIGTGADTTLLPTMAYEIRINMTNQPQLNNSILTVANATMNSANDQNDSDAAVMGNYAVISLTTDAIGSTNHTYDFGFYYFVCPPRICLPVTVTRN